MSNIFILLIIPLLFLSGHHSNDVLKIRKILSPDKSHYAIITTYHFKSKGSSESKIKIFSSKENVQAYKSFISKDHKHGMEIIKTEWSGDSKFFVFNGVIQGGHQPGHLPTYFFSRVSNKIQSLDPLLGIWVTGNFNILSNDRLSVPVRDRLPNGSFSDSLVKKIDLKDLRRK